MAVPPRDLAKAYALFVVNPDYDWDDLDSEPLPYEVEAMIESGLTAVVASLTARFPDLTFTWTEE